MSGAEIPAWPHVDVLAVDWATVAGQFRDRRVLKFFAKGDAKGQGSVHALPSRKAQRQGKGLRACTFDELVLTSDSKDLKRWRAMVRNEARCAWIRAAHAAARALEEGNPLRDAMWPAGPVRLILVFRLPRPKKLQGLVALPHTTRPDLDKLIRAVKDALTGVLYTDDGQVQMLLAQKFIAAPEQLAGVEVTAWQ